MTRHHQERRTDAGFTMIELVVVMGLFTVLGAIVLGVGLSSARVADDVVSATDVTEEARLAIERVGRELRQASGIGSAVVDDQKRVTSISLQVDFNGNGAIDVDAADPEVLTYRWDAVSGLLTLTGNDVDGSAVTRPVLAGGVESVDISLRSSQWIYDSDGDGTTTWQELDASSIGNGNVRPDGGETALVDLVRFTLTVRDGDVRRTFTTQADMRNRRHAS